MQTHPKLFDNGRSGSARSISMRSVFVSHLAGHKDRSKRGLKLPAAGFRIALFNSLFSCLHSTGGSLASLCSLGRLLAVAGHVAGLAWLAALCTWVMMWT